MPKLIRIALTPRDEIELKRRARDRETPPQVRERLEMVRLSARGWTIPRISQHLELHEHTVRRHIKDFRAGGFDALLDRHRPGRRPQVTAADLLALQRAVARAAAEGHTWGLVQMAQWLAQERGVTISSTRLGALLRAARSAGRK